MLSVCLSHGWITQKWCKLESPNLHLQLPGKLVSGTVKLFHKFEEGHPEQEGLMRGGWAKFVILANKSLYLSNGAR